MRILLAVAFVSTVCGVQCASQLFRLEKSNRQKRLIFYDDQGHLMKNYANTLYHFGPKTQENLFQWTFLNTYLSPIFPNLGRTSLAYMVPVSDAVVQQINKDPIYQNKLLYLTYLDPIVQANPLCNGKRTQIPSSNLCNNYVNCWDGWGFEQECPPGLLFSTDGFCDYPMNVNCHNRKLKNPNPLCDNDFQATVNSANCNEFFICVNSIPVTFKCPGDLAFSERLGVCDFPSRVDCNSTNDATLSPSDPQIVQLSTQSSPINAPVTPGPVVQEASMVGDKNMAVNKYEYNTQNPNPLCDNDFQATVNSANCNEFFICVNSIPVTFKCPGDLAFSERLGVCDFPSRVDCNSTNDATLSPSDPQIVQLSTQSSPINAPVTPGPVVQEASMVGDKNMAVNKYEYNTQTWSSTHVAISRQDAIRQLKLGSIDEASMKN